MFNFLKSKKSTDDINDKNAFLQQNVADESDDVIAAISAAVMMMYEGTGITPIIRSVKPFAYGARSVWKAAGVANNTRAF